ncbi:MFS transporter [Streptomyces sp. NPDC020875]|uniref:MFS transporter n=1 Tax=Streptomyces sp. NPDC020875 TaxID=3154898 RepID=UPI003408C430
MPNSPAAAGEPRAGRREWTAFVVLLLPLLLVSMDVSVLYFAIPAINRELDPDGAQQLWILDSYAFALAGLLLTMGSLGDRIGRRRLLMAGAAAFGAASVLAAYADTAETLIAARVLLGIGGATLMPSTMALVRTLFRDARQRTLAIGIWSSTLATGVALGSVLGGVLLERFWWGSVFLVNVPAMALLLVLAPVLVPESKDPAPGPFDLPSVLLSAGSVLPAVYGLKEIAAEGPEPAAVLCLFAGTAVGALFVHRQRTRRDAMISRDLFVDRIFGRSAALLLTGVFALMGTAYFTTQYLQSVLGLGPLEAALWSVVPAVPVGAAAPAAGALARHLPRRAVVCGAFLLAASGFAALSLAGTDQLALVLVSTSVTGSGLVSVLALMNDRALSAAPPDKAGAAASLLETATEFGGALGMAVLGSIGTAAYRAGVEGTAPDGLPPGAAETARETLGGAVAVAGRLPAELGGPLLTAARDAFVDGMRLAALSTAGLMVCAAVLAVVLLGRERTPRHESPGPDAVPEPAARP